MSTKCKRYAVGKDYFDDIETAKSMSDVTGHAVIDNNNWGRIVYDNN